MKLVVDTNILIASLIRNSTTRSVLLNPNHDFYVPEYAIDEVNKHMGLIVSKSGLKSEEVELVLDIILENIEIIPMREMQTNLKRATDSLQSDEKDIPFLALALTISCDGIWSNDEDLKKQQYVKVWNTTQILEAV